MKTQFDTIRRKELKLYRQDEKVSEKKAETQKTNVPKEKVEVFEVESLKEKISQVPDVDLEKVKEMKQRIKNGTLAVDAEKIAGSLIDEALQNLE